MKFKLGLFTAFSQKEKNNSRLYEQWGNKESIARSSVPVLHVN